MSEVKRWSRAGHGMGLDPEGGWIAYEDYASLRQRLEESQERNERFLAIWKNTFGSDQLTACAEWAEKILRERNQAQAVLGVAQERNIKLQEEYEEAAYEARELWGAVEARDQAQTDLKALQETSEEIMQNNVDYYRNWHEAQAALAEASLWAQGYQWSDFDREANEKVCPVCCNYESQGHNQLCPLRRLLSPPTQAAQRLLDESNDLREFYQGIRKLFNSNYDPCDLESFVAEKMGAIGVVVEAARECDELCPAGKPHWTFTHGHDKLRKTLAALDSPVQAVQEDKTCNGCPAHMPESWSGCTYDSAPEDCGKSDRATPKEDKP